MKNEDIIVKQVLERNPEIPDTDPDAFVGDQPQGLLDRLEGLEDLKYGFFTHFGLYTEGEVLESGPLSYGAVGAREKDKAFNGHCNKDYDAYSKGYRALNKKFNPQKFDPKEGADLVQDMGCKYFGITTKHHDGFCLGDTKTTDYKITGSESPYGKDIIGPLFKEMQDRGIPIGAYFSKPDGNSPLFGKPGEKLIDRNVNYDITKDPERGEKFVDFTHKQLKELVTEHGPIDCLGFDGDGVQPHHHHQDLKMEEIARFSYEAQPGLIMADRRVGGKYENFVTPEQKILSKPLECPGETCITLGENGSYHPGDPFKSAEGIVQTLIQTIAFGGNLFLDIGPKKDGSFPMDGVAIALEAGKGVKKHDEAIFRTRKVAPGHKNDAYYTRSKDSSFVYAFIKDTGKDTFKLPEELADYGHPTFLDHKQVNVNKHGEIILGNNFEMGYQVIKFRRQN